MSRLNVERVTVHCLTHTALALLLLTVPQRAFTDEFSEGVRAALVEYFDVSDPATLAARIATDSHLRGGPSSGAAADGFAQLLYTKSAQKLSELQHQSKRDSRSQQLSGGQSAFTRHLTLAASEALKIIDGKRRPVDPRQSQDGDFLNDFADRYSALVQPSLDTLRQAREEQQQEALFARAPQSQQRLEPAEDPLGKPHLNKVRKRRVPAPEETAAAKHWAEYADASPRQIEDLLVDLNTAGEDRDTRELRSDAARTFVERFYSSTLNDGGILGRATSKDISAATRWKEFGLRDVGYRTLRALSDLRNQENVGDLRRRAYATEPSQTARRELVRRVNQNSEADPLGSAIRSDFRNMRPELLLAEESKVVASAEEAAKSLAHLLGASNTVVLGELARSKALPTAGDAAVYKKRVSCAAALALHSRDPKAEAPIETNCEGQQSFRSAFETALKKDQDRYREYQNWIEAAKDPGRLEAARSWMLDPSKSGYQQENLMDRLGERVLSALDSRLPKTERQAAFDEAITLAKILGHQDPVTLDWSLDLVTRDAGVSSEQPVSQTLILGQGEEIFAALARFSQRDTENHAFKSATHFGTRTRFQSFVRDPRSHSTHLADKATRVYYAPDGEDKSNSLGTGTVSNGSATHIGKRASLVPAGLQNTPVRVPASGTELTAKVEIVLASSACVKCHAAVSVSNLKSFYQSAGLDGKMPSGPSLREALAGEPTGFAALEQFLEGRLP